MVKIPTTETQTGKPTTNTLEGTDGVWRTAYSRHVTFGAGKLGFMAQGMAKGKGGGIRIIYITKDGQGYTAGVRAGDMVAAINGKPIANAMKDCTSTEEFSKLARTLQRPLNLDFLSTEVDDRIITERNIIIGAGQCYKRVVEVKKGQLLRMKFWISEPGLDIGFAIEEPGHKNVVYPHTKVWNEACPCGPSAFTVERDGKLVLSWENSHSWLRAKTLNYNLEVLPCQTSPDAVEKMAGEVQNLKGVIGLVDNKITSMEMDLSSEKANKAELQKTLEKLEAQMNKSKAAAKQISQMQEAKQQAAQSMTGGSVPIAQLV